MPESDIRLDEAIKKDVYSYGFSPQVIDLRVSDVDVLFIR